MCIFTFSLLALARTSHMLEVAFSDCLYTIVFYLNGNYLKSAALTF